MTRRRNRNFRFVFLCALSAVALIPFIYNTWNFVTSIKNLDYFEIGAVIVVILMFAGSAIYAVKYWQFYRRQNLVPLAVQKLNFAGSSIRRVVAIKALDRLGRMPESDFRRPVLLWSATGLTLFDTSSGAKEEFPYSYIKNARFSQVSASTGYLGYLRFVLIGLTMKCTVWVFDGYGKSFPIDVEREAEFLSMIGQLKSK